MDDMMRGQRGWRELAVLGDKINKFTGMIEGLIWSPRSGEGNHQVDDWAFEEGPHSDFSGPTSGSTACVAIIRNNQLVVANAGDSRCVISRKGQAYNLSRDHKPDLELERERILKAGGFIHAGRTYIDVRALERDQHLSLLAAGDMEFKQNKFLPAEKQIVTSNPDINTESKLSVICERVLDRCLAPSTAGGEGCDNMTMIIVQFKKPIILDTSAEASASTRAETTLKTAANESS
ncbi:hypothetical protein RJ639_004046 [Escallonia herrerae]|uniref:PPM-type phosphatase domain-containing protein n=1 Tax=Escallonia herrerae TaxID=1293975 RepID=A0AA88W2M4_9ASTE|nr:hypothetical protein RJ639_004046 [Escallonia herrerae]